MQPVVNGDPRTLDGVPLDTGIAGAKQPAQMAHAMRQAIEAGFLAYRWGASRAGCTRRPRRRSRA
jgi:thiazole synthase ThiGH ThiG subunit